MFYAVCDFETTTSNIFYYQGAALSGDGAAMIAHRIDSIAHSFAFGGLKHVRNPPYPLLLKQRGLRRVSSRQIRE